MAKTKECYKKSSASMFTVHPKKQKTVSAEELSIDDDKTGDTLIEEFERNIPSDWESEISNKIETERLNKMVKKRGNFSAELESSSNNSTFSCFQSYKSGKDLSFSDEATNISVRTAKTCIKKEVLSDEETDSIAICSNELVNNLQGKYSEGTKTDTLLENGDNRHQVFNDNGIISRIKTEPVSSDSEPDVKNDSLNIQNSGNDRSVKYGTCKTKDSDCEASQSIIDTAPMLYSSSRIDCNSGIFLQRKIKEEVESDTEDLSQSLVSTADPNFVSQSISPHKPNEENFHNEKSKEFFNSCMGDKLKKEVYRKNASISVPPELLSKSSIDVLPQLLNSENENLPYTQKAHSPAVTDSSSDDDDIPCTQAVSSPAAMEDTSGDDLPCTQGVFLCDNRNNFSGNCDLPCTQTVSVSRNDVYEDKDLPCTQVVAPPISRSNWTDDDLPCTQVVASRVARSNLTDDDLPCTQVVIPNVTRRNLMYEDLPCTQAVSISALENNSSDDDLPCTQAISLSLAKPDVLEDDNLPSTQAVCSPFVNLKSTSNILSAQKECLKEICVKKEPLDDFVPKELKNLSMCDEVPATQVNVLQTTRAKNLLNSYLEECSDDAFPPTQINFKFLKPVAVSYKPDISRTHSTDSELIPTQCLESSKSLSKKSFSNYQSNNQDLPATQMLRTWPETIALPETQSNVVNELFDLPATQIAVGPLKGFSVPCENDLTKGTNSSQFMNTNSFDLPVTQGFCGSSKEKNISKFQNKNINDESFSLPATQVFNTTLKQTHSHRNSIDNEDSESISFPLTQINVSSSKAVKDIDAVAIENFKNGPTGQTLKKVLDANLREVSSVSSEVAKKSFDKLMQSKNTCPDSESEKTSSTNIDEILSNIKHLVKNLSAKTLEKSTCEVAENNKNLLLKNQENVSNSNLNNETIKSELSGESTTTENTFDGLKDCNNLDKENLHLDLESEKLSHEMLREIASKSSHVVRNKNVGIHKHLPQVIAKLPIKDHIKLKPSNRRTFSFEEVAKLEEPQKIHSKPSNDFIQNISNDDTIENSASDDELPPTQKVDFESIMRKPAGNEKNNYERPLNTVGIKNCSVHQPELNSLKTTKSFHYSSCSRVDGARDVRITQLTACQNKDIDSSKMSPLVSSSKSKSFSKAQACTNIENKSIEFSSLQHINKDTTLSSFNNEVILPTTGISTINENILSKQMDTNELLPVFDKNNVPLNKEKYLKKKSAVNIISVKSHITSKHSKDKKSDVDIDHLTSTRVCNDVSKKDTSSMSNKPVHKTENSKFHQNSYSKVDCDDTYKKKTSAVKTSEEQKIKEPANNKTKKHSSEYEFDDLPATQMSKNTTNTLMNFHNDDLVDRDNLNSSFELMKQLGNVSPNKNNPFRSQKLSKATGISNSTVHKGKYSDVHKIKENLKNTLQNKLSNLENKESVNQKRSERSCEPERNVLERLHKNLSSNKLKVTSVKRNHYKDEKCMIQKGETTVSDCQNILLDEKVVLNSTVQRPVSDTPDEQLDFSSFDNNYVVTVKQEKIDHDFEVPFIETQKFNGLDSSASHDIGRIRIKTENLSDSFPSTVITTFNETKNSVDGSVIKDALLSSTSIKEEICSDDDEITIIKTVENTHSKTQEEIIIDDEENELIFPHASEKSQSCFIKQEKEISDHAGINIASVKVEKISYSETILPEIKHQSMKKSKHVDKKDSKRSSTTKEKEQNNDKHCARSTITDKSNKPGGKRKISSDCQISKEETKKARNENLQSKPKSISHKHKADMKRSKDLADSVSNKKSEKKPEYDSLRSKVSSSKSNSEFSSMQLVQNQENLILSTNKQSIQNSEKENNKGMKKDIIITLKPTTKRSLESSETKSDHKRVKYNCLDSESCSSENSCNKIHLGTTNSNIKPKKNCDIMDDRVSSSTVNSDLSIERVNLHFAKNSSTKTLQTKDVKKILNKQDLKEEIANEVKLILKPFFGTGLISKEDYKDIMRRAVPKIFMNCHNCINQEKIRKLVLSYVTMLSKS